MAVARAVIASPKLILADEPTGNLHSAQGKEIMELFKKLNDDGTTIVQVTHSETKRRVRQSHHQPGGWLAGELRRRNIVEAHMSATLESERKTFPESSNANAPRVLIADDQPDVLEALRLLLKGEGYQIEPASSPAGVLTALDARDFDVVLMDLNYTRDTTSGQEGLDLLSRIQALDSTLPVVVMTAWGSVKVAVEAMRRGARDFVQKPWENERLLTILRTQIELSRALAQGTAAGSGEPAAARRRSGLR